MKHFRFLNAERTTKLIALCVSVILSATLPVMGQERLGQINGVVTDASGAAVPGATITLTSYDSNKPTTAKSGNDGVYTVNIEPGHYKLRVEATGFSAAEYPDVTVLVGKTLKIDASLPVGGTTQTVEVVDAASKISIQLQICLMLINLITISLLTIEGAIHNQP